MSGISETIEITNKKGLHARASAKFVTLASKLHPATIEVEKDGVRAGGTSIMGLMMLGAARGDHVTIHASGDNASEALERITGLVRDGFGED